MEFIEAENTPHCTTRKKRRVRTYLQKNLQKFFLQTSHWPAPQAVEHEFLQAEIRSGSSSVFGGLSTTDDDSFISQFLNSYPACNFSLCLRGHHLDSALDRVHILSICSSVCMLAMTTAEFEQWVRYAVQLREQAETATLPLAEYEATLKK